MPQRDRNSDMDSFSPESGNSGNFLPDINKKNKFAINNKIFDELIIESADEDEAL